MIISLTGHRPGKLGGYRDFNPTRDRVKQGMTRVFTEEKPDRIVVGMALGVDTWAAEVALTLRIPFIAAVPFIGQERVWPPESQAHYRDLLTKAERVEIVTDGGYDVWKMQKRNEWMVDNSDALLAVWDGTPGGTANCVKYAEKVGKRIIRLNPQTLPPV